MTKSVSRLALTLGSCAAAIVAFDATTARAHFNLQKPPSWAMQDSSGGPQKSAPCGETDSSTVPMQAVPTNTVTPFNAGETITITINETVYHPGHYRVALAVSDRSELPAEPTVTPGGGVDCGSAEIQASPTFPVLADGMLKHTSKFSGAQSFQVTLPTNVTCTKCTLQIIEFMGEHGKNNPGGCFYHHCADISIKGGGGAAGTGGASGQGGSGGASSSGSGGRGAGSGGAEPQAGRGGGAMAGASSGGTTTVGGMSTAGGMGAAGSPSVAGATASGGTLGAGGAPMTSGAPPSNMTAGNAGHAAGAPPAPPAAGSDDGGGCAFSAEGSRGGSWAWLLPAAWIAVRGSKRRRRS